MQRTLVLGLGNPLMGDDGVGFAALERLRADYDLPPEVRPLDGGTLGLNLLPLLEAADEVILLDAIDTGAAPGAVVALERHELPRYFLHKLSPHQIDLREVLALAEWRGTLPGEIVAFGVQPARVELYYGLSPEVADEVGYLAALAAARLASLGHECPRRGSLAYA